MSPKIFMKYELTYSYSVLILSPSTATGGQDGHAWDGNDSDQKN